MTKEELVADSRGLLERLNSNMALLASEHGVETQCEMQTMSVHCIGAARVPLRQLDISFVQEL